MQFSKIVSPFFLIILSLSFMNVPVSAADLSFSAGGGVWNNEGSGELRYKDNPTVDVNDLNYDKENRGYIWAELRHPIPVLPNLRIEYVDLKLSGYSNQGFVWDGSAFKADSYSETKLTQLDMILFYNVLNVHWFELDLGADVKYLDFKFDADGVGSDLDHPGVLVELKVHEDETLYVPFAYGKTRFNIPATNFGVEGEVKYVKYKSSSILDTSIKADYRFDLTVVKFGIEAGYRFENIDINEDDISGVSFDLDVDIKGPFAGVFIKF